MSNVPLMTTGSGLWQAVPAAPGRVCVARCDNADCNDHQFRAHMCLQPAPLHIHADVDVRPVPHPELGTYCVFHARQLLETLDATGRTRVCRRCGCSEANNADCGLILGDDGCEWVDPTLCSACVPPLRFELWTAEPGDEFRANLLGPAPTFCPHDGILMDGPDGPWRRVECGSCGFFAVQPPAGTDLMDMKTWGLRAIRFDAVEPLDDATLYRDPEEMAWAVQNVSWDGLGDISVRPVLHRDDRWGAVLQITQDGHPRGYAREVYA